MAKKSFKQGKQGAPMGEILMYLGIAAGIVILITVVIVLSSGPEEDPQEPTETASTPKKAPKKAKKAKKVEDKDGKSADDKAKAEKNKDEKEPEKKDPADTKKEGENDGTNQQPQPDPAITYNGPPIFDANGNILYNGQYMSIEKFEGLKKLDPELNDIKKNPDLVITEFTGKQPAYQQYVGKKNTIQNWKKIGLIPINNVFFTKKELEDLGYGYIKNKDQWDKITDLEKAGLIKNPDNGYYYTAEELKADGYVQHAGAWRRKIDLKKEGFVELADGTWDTPDNLKARGYYHDKDTDQWFSEKEMGERGFLHYKGEWKTRGEWLANESVAVFGNEVMPVDDAKKRGLKQDDSNNEWYTQEGWYEAKGYKKVGEKWLSPEDYAKYEAEQERLKKLKEEKDERDKAMKEKKEKEKKAEALFEEAAKGAQSNNVTERNAAKAKLTTLQKDYADTYFYKRNKAAIEKMLKALSTNPRRR